MAPVCGLYAALRGPMAAVTSHRRMASRRRARCTRCVSSHARTTRMWPSSRPPPRLRHERALSPEVRSRRVCDSRGGPNSWTACARATSRHISIVPGAARSISTLVALSLETKKSSVTCIPRAGYPLPEREPHTQSGQKTERGARAVPCALSLTGPPARRSTVSVTLGTGSAGPSFVDG